MLNSPSYVSKQCQKPSLAPPEVIKQSAQEIQHRMRQDVSKKQLTSVRCNGAVQNVMKLVNKPGRINHSLQSRQLQQSSENFLDKDCSPRSTSFFERIQSILSYSVQIDDEERLLLKSIQLDVTHAIKKYQTEIKHNQEISEFKEMNDIKEMNDLKEINQTKELDEPKKISLMQETVRPVFSLKTKTMTKSFIIEGNKQRQKSLVIVETKKLLDRQVGKFQTRNYSQKQTASKSKQKKSQDKRKQPALQNKENINVNLFLKRSPPSMKPGNSSIKEVDEYSSTKKDTKNQYYTLQNKSTPMKMNVNLYGTRKHQY